MTQCNQWLSELASPEGLLADIQQFGRESLLTNGWPTQKLESWRLTDINKFSKILKLPLNTIHTKRRDNNDKDWASIPNNAIRIILEPNTNSLNSNELPTGVEQLTQEEIEKHLNVQLQEKKANQKKSSASIAINDASTSNILGLKVVGQKIPGIEIVMPAKNHTLSSTKMLLILEENTKLDLLQVAIGEGDSAHSHSLEIHLEKEAELNHGFLALGGGEASCLTNICVKQKEFSQYYFTSIQHGWSISRLEPEIIQLRGNGNTTLNGLQLTNNHEQIATHSYVRFEGPNGSLNQLQKAVANQNSHSIFNGIISVPQIAQKTDASQLSRNLLLSKRARIDTKPELEIIADDVRCAHGATITQLQEDELFYLRSRGISAKQANSLILQGYCREIIDNLPISANRWDILNQLLSNIK